jgi:hypothetical protein
MLESSRAASPAPGGAAARRWNCHLRSHRIGACRVHRLQPDARRRQPGGRPGSRQTEGWWTVGANQCAEVIREELANRFIYVYANDVFGQPILSGTTEMCVGKKRFVIRGIESCWQRGHLAVKFYEVDTQAVERWTLFLTSPGGQ